MEKKKKLMHAHAPLWQSLLCSLQPLGLLGSSESIGRWGNEVKYIGSSKKEKKIRNCLIVWLEF